MNAEQTAYLATCGLMFAFGLVVMLAGVGFGHLAERSGRNPDNFGLVIGLGLVCMVVGPLMLIGFPS